MSHDHGYLHYYNTSILSITLDTGVDNRGLTNDIRI